MQKIGTCLGGAYCPGHFVLGCDICTCLPQYTLNAVLLLQCHIGMRIEQSVDIKSFLT